MPQGARAAARGSQIGPIGSRWLGIAARLACTHTRDGEPITQRCAHSVDTRTSAWLNTRFRTGRPWLWRVSQTRRTSVERIMPSGTNIVLLSCQAELPTVIKIHRAKEGLILRKDKDFCLRRRWHLPIRRLNAYIVESPVVRGYIVLRVLGHCLARLQV